MPQAEGVLSMDADVRRRADAAIARERPKVRDLVLIYGALGALEDLGTPSDTATDYLADMRAKVWDDLLAAPIRDKYDALWKAKAVVEHGWVDDALRWGTDRIHTQLRDWLQDEVVKV